MDVIQPVTYEYGT